MNKEILWDEYITNKLLEKSEKELDEFLTLLNYIEKKGVTTQMPEELYGNLELWEWIATKEQIELRDIKKELFIKINKSSKIDKEKYIEKSSSVGELGDAIILVLAFDSEKVFYISNKEEYYTGVRKYLSMEKKSDFCEDLEECFCNIFFHEDIATTINSLNRSFEELREEIVEHLTKINDYHEKFSYLLSQNKSNQFIAQKFYADTGIDCSPQAGREGVRLLKMECFNSLTQRKETIICELHTKFKTFNVDRTKQDRIYFFPGRLGIQEGKIIVKHIGKHL